jgi:metal-sulfur cluster biosynthetic enzyme
MDEKHIQKALQAVIHPKLRKSLIDIGMIRDISIRGALSLLPCF